MNMSRIFGLLLLVIATVSQTIAQEILVLDKVTSKPIADVVIYTTGNNTSVQTNQLGKTSINQFSKDALLIFQHPSYEDFNISAQ